MLRRLSDTFIDFLLDVRQKRAIVLLVILLLLLNPLILYTIINYRSINELNTAHLYNERQNTANLAAALLEERFGRLVDLGVSLASRVRFRQLIEQGEWNEAVQILADVPANFPFLDRLFLSDPEGTLMADLPHLTEVVGRNFAFRDWYQGVSREWRPYISEVYRRTAVPQYNVVAVATPIQKGDGTILGVLVLQVRLDQLDVWARAIGVGDGGFVYFVDQYGHPVSHPQFPAQAEIADFSEVPEVQKIAEGARGIELVENPVTGGRWLAAYQQVLRFGWGVAVVQREEEAFAFRGNILSGNLGIGIAFIGISILFALFIFRVIHQLSLYRQKEARIFENMGDGVFTIDRGWKITAINDEACRLSGWKKEEVLGKPFREIFQFVRAHDKKENIVFIEEAMLLKKTHFMENNTVLITKNGSELPVSDSAAPILDENDEATGAVIIFRDATKEIETTQLKSDFAYASHQLRTPVTQALWSIETAYEARDRKDIEEYLRVARQSMQSVVELVTQVVEVSELDNGRVHPRTNDVNLSQLISDIAQSFQRQSEEKKIALQAETIDPNIVMRTGKELVRNALSRIIENALVYNQPGGQITIETETDEDDLVFAIHDTGIGIPEEEQPLVFTKFFRGSNFKTHEIPGAGLGLYIAREYVKLCGGKMWFKSREGRGSTFFVSLPLQKK